MYSKLPPLPTIGEVVKMYKLRSRRHLAQNFLMDMNLTRKIVRSAGNLRGIHVCEVGPGPGGITRALLDARVKSLSVIELDDRFIPSLEYLASFSDDRLRIFRGDVLKFDLTDLFPEESRVDWFNPRLPPIHLIGNLPFNVSTPLIIRWLRDMSTRSGAWSYGRVPLTLTFQKEVANRMAAKIMSDYRCRLSVMCQYLCNVYVKFIIPGRAFVPEPEVDVGVVKLIPRKQPLIDLPFPLVEKVTRNLFHHRQKRFRRGIETLFPPERQQYTERLVEEMGGDMESRPYVLTMDEIARICHSYNKICQEDDTIFHYDYRSSENAAAWKRRKRWSYDTRPQVGECFNVVDSDCSSDVDYIDCSNVVDSDCSSDVDNSDCSNVVDSDCSNVVDSDCSVHFSKSNSVDDCIIRDHINYVNVS